MMFDGGNGLGSKLMGGAVVVSGCWVTYTMLANGFGFCFEFYFIFWICLRCDVNGSICG